MKVVNEKFYGSEATGMDSIFEKKIINYVSEAAIKSMVHQVQSSLSNSFIKIYFFYLMGFYGC